MKNYSSKYLVILLLVIAGSVTFGRINSFAGLSGENIILLTDRSIYITGEQVQFYASLSKNQEQSTQSLVIYAEIITPNGNKIASGKYLVEDGTTRGCLNLPGDLRTGAYYVRAYTKMMRNYGPESYAYRQIRIVNPGKREVLSTDINPAQTEFKSKTTQVEDLNSFLSVSLNKTKCTSRDSVTFSLHPERKLFDNVLSLCLSVVPEGTKSSNGLSSLAKKDFNPTVLDYYPETRGVSLNGKLTDANSSIPVKGRRVNLSIIGEGRDFMATRTDSSGKFYFALPDYSGSHDLYLCAERIPASNTKIWIDNDFCTLPVTLPSPVIEFSDKESQSAFNMAVNLQIDNRFKPQPIEQKTVESKDLNSFYGKPTTVLYLDQYIQLPTLEEYFNELPSLVRVRKRAGQKYFKVIGSRDLSFYDPLVLVDWVAVDEPEKILAAMPQNVSRIEIVNEAYVKGDQTYGGIVSIISKKGDFAGVDLPSTGVFINYRFLAENNCNTMSKDKNPAQPDCRNTLLWIPGIKMKSGQDSQFSVSAPDTPGKYEVIIEAITISGELITLNRQFEVIR